MKTKKLGKTGLNISKIGLGTWAIGNKDWGHQKDEDSISTIECALELGLNWIDTAPSYGCGYSEEVIGNTIKESNKPYISTKCGTLWDKDGIFFSHIKKKSIYSEVEDSLKRLKLDAIDLYQIHWPKPKEDVEEAWRTVADLVKDGKVRYAGVSNFNAEQIQKIQKIHPVSFVQVPYNMLERGIEKELLSYCHKNNLGVIVYGSMRRGTLTDKFTKEWVKNLSEDDHRSTNWRFKEPELSANLELNKDLRNIAKENNITLSQLAISWVLRRPEITAVIVGARHPYQIKETALAGDINLSKKEIGNIELLLNKREEIIRDGKKSK
jgi:aryl-alcohol dehydrogenase-like predicted oxidoreductase